MLGNLNEMLEVECCQDHSLLSKEDYMRHAWPQLCLRPHGGWGVKPRLAGPEICWHLVGGVMANYWCQVADLVVCGAGVVWQSYWHG